MYFTHSYKQNCTVAAQDTLREDQKVTFGKTDWCYFPKAIGNFNKENQMKQKNLPFPTTIFDVPEILQATASFFRMVQNANVTLLERATFLCRLRCLLNFFEKKDDNFFLQNNECFDT